MLAEQAGNRSHPNRRECDPLADRRGQRRSKLLSDLLKGLGVAEFFKRGAGDCEDFAIAKYMMLRAYGVPEERLRLAIVNDTKKGIHHAILIVYTDRGPIFLDNQIKDTLYTASSNRYVPIFSINGSSWWLHEKPSATQVASAR